MAADYGSLPFAEQIAFFRQKLDLPTERWDDLLGAAHDRAFVVAGAMRADLLADLRAAVDKAIAQGATLDEFRRDFRRIVEKNGWTGWTGEGTRAGEAWRTHVIYATNLRTSHAAGRYAQLQEIKHRRPYWRYVHNDTVLQPRPEHLAWHGTVLPADDPWWTTHFAPNGWGCRCRIESLSARDLAREGIDPDTLTRPTDPDDPTGIDRGWGYAPGASVSDELRRLINDKQAKLPGALARDFAAEMVARIPVIRAGDLLASAEQVTLTVKGRPGKDFVDSLREELKKYPDAVNAALRRSDVEVVVANTLTHARPELKGVRPRGWPPGTTWDNVDGCAVGNKAYIAKRYRDQFNKNKWTDSERSVGVMHHEIGHAYDQAIGRASQSAEFLAAYDADVAAAKRPGARPIDSYFLQSGGAGAAETFAEQFANIILGRSDMGMPETYKWIAAQIGLGGLKP